MDNISIWRERAFMGQRGMKDALSLLTQCDFSMASKEDLEELIEEVIDFLETSLEDMN